MHIVVGDGWYVCMSSMPSGSWNIGKRKREAERAGCIYVHRVNYTSSYRYEETENELKRGGRTREKRVCKGGAQHGLRRYYIAEH